MKHFVLTILLLYPLACSEMGPKDPINPFDGRNNVIVDGYNTNQVLNIVQVREMVQKYYHHSYEPDITSNYIYWDEDNIYSDTSISLYFHRYSGWSNSANSESKEVHILSGSVDFKEFEDRKFYFTTIPRTYKWPVFHLDIEYLKNDFDMIISSPFNFYQNEIQDVLLYDDSLSGPVNSLNDYISNIDNGSYRDNNNFVIRFNSNLPLDQSKFLKILWDNEHLSKYYKMVDLSEVFGIHNLGNLNFNGISDSKVNFIYHDRDYIHFVYDFLDRSFYKIDKNDYGYTFNGIKSPRSGGRVTFYTPGYYAYFQDNMIEIIIYDLMNMTYLSRSIEHSFYGNHLFGPVSENHYFIGVDTYYNEYLRLYDENYKFIKDLRHPLFNEDLHRWAAYTIDKNGDFFVSDNSDNNNYKVYHFKLIDNEIILNKEKVFASIVKQIINTDKFILIKSSLSYFKVNKNTFDIDWVYLTHKSFDLIYMYYSETKNIVVFWEKDNSAQGYITILNWQNGNIIKRFPQKYALDNFSIGETKNPEKLCIIFSNGFYGEFSISD